MSQKKFEEPASHSTASDYLNQLKEDPQAMNQLIIVCAVSVVILVILLLWLSRWRISTASRRAILIIGPSDAGKTCLFSHLVHGHHVDTYTSMAENVASHQVQAPVEGKASKTVQIVDLPGHDRLRVAGIEKYKSSARAIIYVVDGANVAKTIADSTEYLFRVLSDPVFHKNAIPVMIVCNKADLDMAKSAKVIERELEKEINLLRDTHSRNIFSAADGSGAVDHIFLGKEGQDFKFTHLPNQVDFCETSAIGDAGDHGLDKLKSWIYSIA